MLQAAELPLPDRVWSHGFVLLGGERFSKSAGVKLLVLSPLVPGDDRAITDEMWIAGARAHFDGPIVVAADMMEL